MTTYNVSSADWEWNGEAESQKAAIKAALDTLNPESVGHLFKVKAPGAAARYFDAITVLAEFGLLDR